MASPRVPVGPLSRSQLRLLHTLHRAGYRSLGAVAQATAADLLRIRWVGLSSLSQLRLLIARNDPAEVAAADALLGAPVLSDAPAVGWLVTYQAARLERQLGTLAEMSNVADEVLRFVRALPSLPGTLRVDLIWTLAETTALVAPQDIEAGTRYLDVDTGHEYQYDGVGWHDLAAEPV